MKQKDILLIAIIVIISGIFSYVISKSVIVPPKNRQQAVEVIDPISANFPQPDSKYFNNQSNDPTQVIRISNNSNADPFSNQ